MAIDSEWGFTTGTLTDPPAPASSEWGYASTALNRPHHPVGVLTATGMKYVPLSVWDGSVLR